MRAIHIKGTYFQLYKTYMADSPATTKHERLYNYNYLKRLPYKKFGIKTS